MQSHRASGPSFSGGVGGTGLGGGMGGSSNGSNNGSSGGGAGYNAALPASSSVGSNGSSSSDMPIIARGPPPASLGFGKSRNQDRPQSSVYGPSTSLGFGFKTTFDSSYSRSNTLPNALGISAKGGSASAGGGGSTAPSEFGARSGSVAASGSGGSLNGGVSGRSTPGAGSSSNQSGRGNAVRSPDGRVLFLSNPASNAATRYSSSSSTGFMVPISGTGARQKVSIVNAGQRKKAALAAATASDFAKWPQEMPQLHDAAPAAAETEKAGDGAVKDQRNGSTPHLATPNGAASAAGGRERTYLAQKPKQGQSLRAYNAAKKAAEDASRSENGEAFGAIGVSNGGPSNEQQNPANLPAGSSGPVSISSLRAAKAKREAEESARLQQLQQQEPYLSQASASVENGRGEAGAGQTSETANPLTSIRHIRNASGRQVPTSGPGSSSSSNAFSDMRPSASASSASEMNPSISSSSSYQRLDRAPTLDFQLPSTSFFSGAKKDGKKLGLEQESNASGDEARSPDDDFASMFKGAGSLRVSSLPPYEPLDAPGSDTQAPLLSEKDALGWHGMRDRDKSLPPTPVTPVESRSRTGADSSQDQYSLSGASSVGSQSRGETTPSPLPSGLDSLSTSSHDGSRAETPGKHRPPKPVRSPDRPPAAPTPDPATLARLESNSRDSPSLDSAVVSQAIASFTTGTDPKTFVPAGALTRTRKRDPLAKPPTNRADTSRSNESRFSASTTASGPIARPDFGVDKGSDIEEESLDGDMQAEGSALPATAWFEVEDALRKFKEPSPAGGFDKGGTLRTVLLPFLQLEADRPNVVSDVDTAFTDPRNRRALFFDWISRLLVELQHVQTSADRGAILESIGFILESCNLSPRYVNRDKSDFERFTTVFGHILTYAIGELNKKGVYQNTLIFSGRLLAIAFFRLEGVASKLLRALPVNRFALERISAEAAWDDQQPTDFERYTSIFPEHLRYHCFQDAQSYLHQLDTLGSEKSTGEEDDRYLVRQGDVEVEMSGNWLRRWQSDDSELFFSFCRNYHRQLSSLMSTSRYRRMFFGAPGYAHLATCIHQKCVSLVHREILSVTTLSSQKNFNPGETANVLSGSTAGKPRHLEAANRRCTAIVVDVVRAPGVHNPIFTPMIQTHIKCLIKRTSLYDVQGVFCLLDWMDSVFTQVEGAELQVEDVMDVSFIIDMVALLLENADHALALMRTIAFCYANFGLLISTKRNRLRFCEEILLKSAIFHKLFLSWSFTIRAYFLHLLVFRLGHVTDFPAPADDPKNHTAVSIARLFSQRLDEIRKRHDELSPSDTKSNSDEEEDAKLGRRTSFVSTIKRTPSVHNADSLSSPTSSKAERVLGIGMPDPFLASTNKGEAKAQSRAAKWLRALGGKGNKTNAKRSPTAKSLRGDSRFDGQLTPASVRSSGSLTAMMEESSSDDDSDDEIPLARTLSQEQGNKGMDLRANMSSPIAADHIASDAAFDLQSPTSISPHVSTMSSRRSASPRVSRAFSKRSSLVPGPALDLVIDEDQPPVPSLPAHLRPAHYHRSQHVYAVQSLREYETTVQEHDDFMAQQPDGEKSAVPRLPVNWPAMWQGD